LRREPLEVRKATLASVLAVGVNANISPIDESPAGPVWREEHSMCSAKTIAGFYRRAREARKFSEETNNPVKKRTLTRSSESGCPWLATASVTAKLENLRGDCL